MIYNKYLTVSENIILADICKKTDKYIVRLLTLPSLVSMVLTTTDLDETDFLSSMGMLTLDVPEELA